jgi:SRSO17 transposase
MQHLLARAVWEEDAVRDDVRAYLVEHLGNPAAVLVIDETGDLKKGTTTVGVQRQDTGTAGRIKNAQVAVYLVYASDAGHAMIDRDLYLPQGWTCEDARCRAAGILGQFGFATKPALAQAMIARALDVGVPAAWVTGDEVDGACPRLRAELEIRGIGYVLAVACDHPVRAGGVSQRADALLRCVPARAWQCISAGRGAKGHRHDDWAFLRLDGGEQDAQYWLLVRRNQRTGELAFYRCFMPHPVPLATLVGVAGRRWSIEERIKTSKGLCGLDQHQVRRWRSWYRWMTLAMLAHAFLVVAALTSNTRHPPPPELIPLTCNEVQHLVATLLARPAAQPAHRVRWSAWRRRQQARARTCHYRRQTNGP